MAMRPVTFKWKGRDERDFGLIAEEVAKTDPRYVTYQGGRIEGVKYPQLVAVLVNAAKQLEAENAGLRVELARLHNDEITETRILEAQIKDIQRQRKERFAEK